MDTKKKLTIINRLEDIPTFTSEDAEHEFWATHELSDALWNQAEPLTADELPAPRPNTTPVVIDLDEPTIRRVKALAHRRHQDYRVVLRELVTARLAEEEQQAG